MPPRTFTGTSVASILARIRETLGPDAMVLDVRKVSTPSGPRFEALVGTEADPGEAAGERVARTSRSGDAGLRPANTAVTARAVRALGIAKGSRRPTTTMRIALVGPTGAGKTTTIAKLASHPGAFGGRPTGLLCLDACRIGAAEQSRIFAKLAGLSLEIVAEPEAIPAALHRLRHREVILVDTAGRGPLARADRDLTRRLLEPVRPTEVHLLLPANVRASYARQVITEHRPLGLTHLLPTKVDECPDDDWLFRLAALESLPIRWVAGGHRIPEDLYDARVDDRPARGADAWGTPYDGMRGTA